MTGRAPRVHGDQARKQAQANIRLWDAATCREVQELPGHRLTVTQLAFSPSDDLLLSVSKDRQVCLFGKEAASGAGGGDGGDGEGAVARYTLLTALPKAHKRVIWSCRCVSCPGHVLCSVHVRLYACVHACMRVTMRVTMRRGVCERAVGLRLGTCLPRGLGIKQ